MPLSIELHWYYNLKVDEIWIITAIHEVYVLWVKQNYWNVTWDTNPWCRYNWDIKPASAMTYLFYAIFKEKCNTCHSVNSLYIKSFFQRHRPISFHRGQSKYNMAGNCLTHCQKRRWMYFQFIYSNFSYVYSLRPMLKVRLYTYILNDINT